MITRYRVLIYLLGISLLSFGAFSGCKKNKTPNLSTADIIKITPISATSGGIFKSEKGLYEDQYVIARGVCWNTSGNPTINDCKTVDIGNSQNYSSLMTGLSPNTVYSVRAYATTDEATAYGDEKQFSTNAFPDCGLVTDIDGNVYHTITIGNHCWMLENLKVTHYRNGDPIPNITDDAQWSGLSTGAYCNYNNDENIAGIYGRLYNSYALSDSRNIAPVGWHVPTSSEWLIGIGGGWVGEASGGDKLKETGTVHWASPNCCSTNESGFTALPTGSRSQYGIFSGLHTHTSFPFIDTATGNIFTCNLSVSYDYVIFSHEAPTYGFPVRCIKD